MINEKRPSEQPLYNEGMSHSTGSSQKWRNLRWLLKLTSKSAQNKARSSQTLPSFYRTRFMLEDAVVKLQEMDSDDYFSKVTNSYKYHGILDNTESLRDSTEIPVDDVIINGFSQLEQSTPSDRTEACSTLDRRDASTRSDTNSEFCEQLNVTSGLTETSASDSDSETYVPHL